MREARIRETQATTANTAAVTAITEAIATSARETLALVTEIVAGTPSPAEPTDRETRERD